MGEEKGQGGQMGTRKEIFSDRTYTKKRGEPRKKENERFPSTTLPRAVSSVEKNIFTRKGKKSQKGERQIQQFGAGKLTTQSRAWARGGGNWGNERKTSC